MAQKVTSTDIKLALKEFHNGKPSYFITECKTCSTYFPDPQGLLKFDGLAITKSYTKPNIIGYEIKVSRNDFLQDNKWHLYLQYCNEFYFVVPKGLVKKEELPDHVGLIYFNPDTKGLRTVKKALYRQIEEPVGVYKYIIFSRLEEDRIPFYNDRAEYLLNSMTKDTYSAIPNRGIQPIINQLRGYKKKIKKDGKVVAEKWIPSILVSDPEATKYCLKLDVRKYYPSIVHDVLKAKYRELFKDEELIWLMDEIIDSISTCPATEENIEILQRLGVAVNIIIDDNGREFVDGVGIPIGNYVSQYDGNFNLSVVDHWLKEVKGVKYYFRYMDDMVIFGSSKEELHKLKRELDEFMAVNLKQVLKHNWQVFPTKVRGVDFVGYRFFGEYTLLRKSTCKTFKRRMLSISSKRENNVSPTYSEWCSFNSYVGWLQHCDSFRLYQKYVEPNVEYMHNYYLKEVKGNAEICKRKNYSGERKAS